MSNEHFFTAAFGIAPIRKMPSGVKIARFSLRGDDWRRFLKADLTTVKPYWSISGGQLLVVTETDADKLKMAMQETFTERSQCG